MHVEERMSYRLISKRIRDKHSIRKSKNTICKMINDIASYSMGDIHIIQEYQPKWEE